METVEIFCKKTGPEVEAYRSMINEQFSAELGCPINIDDGYDPHSLFFLFKYKEKLIGGCRIVLPTARSFPLEAYTTFPESLDRTKTAEITRLFVKKEYRSYLKTENWVHFLKFQAQSIRNISPEITHNIIESTSRGVGFYKRIGLKSISAPFNDSSLGRGPNAVLMSYDAANVTTVPARQSAAI